MRGLRLRVLPPCLPIFFHIKYVGNSIIKAYATWISIHHVLIKIFTEPPSEIRYIQECNVFSHVAHLKLVSGQ